MMNRRIKTGTMMSPSIIKMCDDNLQKANCKSRNDFIEESILFYIGYLNKENDAKYISDSLGSIVTSSLELSENRVSRLLFKLVVEMSMMMNIIGANNDIDEETLKELRGKCIKDVKTSIGSLNMDKIIKYQNEKSS